MTGLQRFIPLVVVVALAVLFFAMMGGDRNPKEIKSVLIGKSAPVFSLPSLSGGQQVTEAMLVEGQPMLVNFFASWCLPCRAEHDNLMTLAKKYNVPILGVAYKDDPAKSQNFLDELGNPYSAVAVDADGRNAINWGVTGVPETFLLDENGIIRYRHWGPIVGNGLEERLLPKLQEVRG